MRIRNDGLEACCESCGRWVPRDDFGGRRCLSCARLSRRPVGAPSMGNPAECTECGQYFARADVDGGVCRTCKRLGAPEVVSSPSAGDTTTEYCGLSGGWSCMRWVSAEDFDRYSQRCRACTEAMQRCAGRLEAIESDRRARGRAHVERERARRLAGGVQ